MDPDGYVFKHRGQAQLRVSALASFPSRETMEFSGVEAKMSFSVVSLGAELGAGWARICLEGCELGEEQSEKLVHGGYSLAAFQWRPLQLIGYRAAYKYVDLHADVGGLLGGVLDGSASRFRASLFAGGGLDVAIPFKRITIQRTPAEVARGLPHRGYVALVVGSSYRFHMVQTPSASPRHELLFALGVRGTM
jgi:hypothetical protein